MQSNIQSVEERKSRKKGEMGTGFVCTSTYILLDECDAYKSDETTISDTRLNLYNTRLPIKEMFPNCETCAP